MSRNKPFTATTALWIAIGAGISGYAVRAAAARTSRRPPSSATPELAPPSLQPPTPSSNSAPSEGKPYRSFLLAGTTWLLTSSAVFSGAIYAWGILSLAGFDPALTTYLYESIPLTRAVSAWLGTNVPLLFLCGSVGIAYDAGRIPRKEQTWALPLTLLLVSYVLMVPTILMSDFATALACPLIPLTIFLLAPLLRLLLAGRPQTANDTVASEVRFEGVLKHPLSWLMLPATALISAIVFARPLSLSSDAVQMQNGARIVGTLISIDDAQAVYLLDDRSLRVITLGDVVSRTPCRDYDVEPEYLIGTSIFDLAPLLQCQVFLNGANDAPR